MQSKYLGDSYDLVKRCWSEILRPIAPLYAHKRFVPAPMATEYETVTTIPVLDVAHAKLPQSPFGILLDPDTGIPLPKETPASVTRAHAPLEFIIELFDNLRPHYMICFDQSCHRKHALGRKEQMDKKMAFLHNHAVFSFYYCSHAPFLFMTKDGMQLQNVFDRLVWAGIPKERFMNCKTRPEAS